MEVSVFDTYVKRQDNSVMHFDIVVPKGTAPERVYHYGNMYLLEKEEEGLLTATQCKFCHIEEVQPFMENALRTQGYCIIEMQGC